MRDEGGSSLELTPRLAAPPTKISIVLENGRLTRSGQYQFLRTHRVDVEAADGLPGSADGVVTVNTGSYTVERLATGGRSRPGETETTTTRYSVSTSRVFGSHRDALPVPTVSIDMVDVQQQRGRDAVLLVFGAVLGALGAFPAPRLVACRAPRWTSDASIGVCRRHWHQPICRCGNLWQAPPRAAS